MRVVANQMQKEANVMKEEATKMKQEMQQDIKDDAERDEQRRKGYGQSNQMEDNNASGLAGKGEKDKESGVEEAGKSTGDQNTKQEEATYLSVARRQYQNRIKGFSLKDHKCSRCWLIKECCVCDRIAPVNTKHECIYV